MEMTNQIESRFQFERRPKGNQSMPTNRTPITHAPRRQITAEMVALFQRCRQMRVERSDLEWEPAGRRAEYIELATQLHRLLGLKPWQCDPLDAGRPPLRQDDPRILADWRAARSLRRLLIGLARLPSGRPG
jgi:hypothetical protein